MQPRTVVFGLPLIALLSILAYNKRFVGAATGIGILLGMTISLLLPVRYTATSRIMTPQQSQSLSALLMMSQLAGSAGGPLASISGGGLSLRNPNDLYVGLLNSSSIADALIVKFGLMKAYKAHIMTDARKELAENTTITAEKSGLIAISVTDRDRALSAAIANQYPEELRDLLESLALTEASQRRLFYEEQLKHAKGDLVQAEFDFQQVQQKKGLVSLDAQAKALIESSTALHAQVAAKQVEVRALRTYSTDRNPSLQLAENELSSLEAQASQLEQRSHTTGTVVPGLQDIASEGTEYLSAEHELQYRQILFDLLLKQYDAARLDEARDMPPIQVVETAGLPERKSSPHRAKISIGFGFIGFVLAFLYIVAREHIRRNPELSQSLTALKSGIWSR